VRKSFVAIACAVVFSCASPMPSAAQVTVFDPTNFAKNTMTELHTLEVTINQTVQIANQLRQIAYDVQNLQNIPNGVWGEVRGDLNALAHVAKVGQNIGYADANLDAEFAQMYPGYSMPTNYASAYQRWANNSLGGIRGALMSAGMQSAQFASEDDVLVNLQALSDGAAGHMQALQVGNMIAVQQVQQLQKLRQLQMAQAQGEFGYLATQQQNDLTKYAALKAWLDSQGSYHSHE
jgi:P-type conjugative transfer protein TrbJ